MDKSKRRYTSYQGTFPLTQITKSKLFYIDFDWSFTNFTGIIFKYEMIHIAIFLFMFLSYMFLDICLILGCILTKIIRNGTVVDFFCEKGWTRKGPKQKQCLDSGFWDPEEKVKCIENHSVQFHWNSNIMFMLILVHTIN